MPKIMDQTSLTATGSATLSGKPLSDNVALFMISGTYGTVSLVFEGSSDGGTNWCPVSAQRYDTGALVNGTISPSDNAELMYLVPCVGLTAVRLRVTAIASGTLVVDARSDCYTLSPIVSVNFTGATVSSLQTFAAGAKIADSQTLAIGDDSDATIGSSSAGVIDILAGADNNTINVGAAGNSFDLKIFGAGASTYTTFDASLDSWKLEDNVFLGFGSNTAGVGTKGDINITWNGTKLLVAQTTANSAIDWGVDGAGIDQVWYGDTASTNMTWDQSADSLIFTGAARIVFTGTTGQPEIHLTDNLADALSIEISGSTDLLVFTTTDDAESVSPIGLRTRQATAVAITGATTLKLSDSGGVFTVSQAAAYDIDLPSPTSGPGCTYFFHLTAAGANNVTLTVAGGAATFVGTITIDGATIPATGSTLTFASGASVLGDSIMVRSLATNLYHVVAIASGAGGITIA